MSRVKKAGATLSATAVVLAFLVLNQNVRAQDFEDTIESEIDMLSEGGAMPDETGMVPVPSPSPKPGAAANGSSGATEPLFEEESLAPIDRKSTRLNSSH